MSVVSVGSMIKAFLKFGVVVLSVVVVAGVLLPAGGRTHCGGRQIKDGTQVRNLVQACFTYSVSSHPESTDAEDAVLDAMHAEAVVDSHQPPAK